MAQQAQQEEQLYFIKMEYKLYAVIHNNIIKNAWWAKTQQEAEEDNPGAICVEVTIENSPWVAESDYTERK